jgi:hypothetical protein
VNDTYLILMVVIGAACFAYAIRRSLRDDLPPMKAASPEVAPDEPAVSAGDEQVAGCAAAVLTPFVFLAILGGVLFLLVKLVKFFWYL